MRAVILAVAFGALTSSAAPIPKSIPKTNADRIIGTWKLVKTSQRDGLEGKSLVEFGRDGTMTVRHTDEGEAEAEVFTGKYRVEGDRIPYTIQRGEGWHTETLRIVKLTDVELIVVDPDDVREEFVREKDEQ